MIGILSEGLSTKQVHDSLIRLGKERWADEFWNEIEKINKRYKKMLDEIDGKADENLGKKILEGILNEITGDMKKELYSMSKKAKNEEEFQDQIESFLKGIKIKLEDSPLGAKFDLRVKVYREYKLHFKGQRRSIDFLVSVGKVKIGMEVKYDLSKASKLQRLHGQIDEYFEGANLDALIIISYLPLKQSTINAIQEREKGKQIRIVTPNKNKTI